MAGSFGVNFLIGAHLQSTVGSAFASLQDKIRATQQSFRNASKQSRQLSEAAAARQRRDHAAETARQQMRQNGHVDDSLRRELAQLNQEYARAARAAGVYGQSVDEINRRQREMARSIEESNRRLANLQTVQAGRDAMRSGQDQRHNVYGNAAKTFAIMQKVAEPLKIGMDFEEAMSKVAAISQASGEDLAKLEAQARELGATTVWSAKEAADGMTFLSMAGFKTHETLAAMPGMLSLASAGNMDLGRTADIASNILTGFGMDADQMGYVADVMAKTFTSSNTSIASLGETFKYCAPSAKAAGQSFQDVAAMIAKLGDAGIQGSMAGTALNAIMLRMASPPKMANEALGQLGVSIADAQGKIKAMPDLLRELGFRMSKLTDIEKVDLARKIFGMENAKSGIALMEQAMKGEIQKMSRNLYEKGFADKVAKQQIDNLSGDLKSLNSAAQEVAICLFQSVSPGLRSVAQGITGIVRPMGEWIKANQQVVQGLVMVGGALVGLKAAGMVFMWLGGVRKSFVGGMTAMRGQVSLACGGVRSAFANMHSALNRPMTFSQAVAPVTNGCERIRHGFQRVRNVLGQTATAMNNVSRASVMAGLKAGASGASAAVGRAGWNMLRLGIKGVGVAFKTALGPVSLLMMGLSLGVDYVMEHWDQFQPYFQSLWDGIKAIFSAVMGWLKPIIDKILGFVGPVVDKIKGLLSGLGKAWDWITGNDKKVDEKVREQAQAKEAQAKKVAVEPVAAEAAVKTPAQIKEEEQWANEGFDLKTTHDRNAARIEAEKEAKKAERKRKAEEKAARQGKQQPASFEDIQIMMDETGDDYGDSLDDKDPGDYLPAENSLPKKRQPTRRAAQAAPDRPAAKKAAQAAPQATAPAAEAAPAQAAPQTRIVQPQVQVAVNVTQNGIPDATFAQGVMNAIKDRQSELEQMISAIVNEQARLAYGS